MEKIERKKTHEMAKKMSSRKFIVWMVWTAISLVALFRSGLPAETIYTYYGLVSLLYIGGNVASQFSPLGKKEADAPKEGEK